MLIVVAEGTDTSLSFQARGLNNAVLDLTSALGIQMDIYNKNDLYTGVLTAVKTYSVGSGVTVITATSGLFEIFFPDTDWDGLGGNRYHWEIAVTRSNGRIHRYRGDFWVEPRMRGDGV